MSNTRPNFISSYLGQFAVQTIEIWQTDSFTGNTPTALKNSVPTVTHSFLVPTHFFQNVSVFSSENFKVHMTQKISHLKNMLILKAF